MGAAIDQDCMVWGSYDAPILVVGMAPGKEELKENSPFVGGSGRLLWALAKNAGFSRQDCLIVNAIGEWPEKRSGAPAKKQYEKYWERFNEIVSNSQARVVVCLGGDALWRLTGLTGIEAWRGYLIEGNEFGTHTRIKEEQVPYKLKSKLGQFRTVRRRVAETPIIPPNAKYVIASLHPSAVIRSQFKPIPVLAADLDRAYRALRGKLDIKELRTMDPFVMKRGLPTSVDVETTLIGNQDIIFRCGAAQFGQAWSLPWDQAEPLIKDVCEDESTLKIFHNAPYDIVKLEEHGIETKGPIFDTMMAAAAVQPDLYKGLESVTSLYRDTKRWKHKSESDPALYNALDNYHQEGLYWTLRGELKQMGILERFENVIMPGIRVLLGLTKTGVRLHPERRDRWVADLSVKMVEAEMKWRGASGDASPTSNPQIADALYGRLGLPYHYSKYGSVTADAAALEQSKEWLDEDAERREKYATAYEAITALLEFRDAATQLKVFTDPRLDRDNRVHPSYLPAHKDSDDKKFGKGLAGTWRLASRNPNFANQPMEARKLYLPDEGCFFAEFDYKQIELRICAQVSNDLRLQEALRGDPFAEICESLALDRVRAKNLVYGTIYGAGPRKLAATFSAHGFKVSEKDCKGLQAGLAKLYPNLWAWRQSIVTLADTQKYIVNPFGWRRYFYQGKKDAPAAINYTPQSTAAGVIWSLLVPLDDLMKKLGGRIANTVYDNFLVCLPEGANAGEDMGKLQQVKALLEQPWKELGGLSVPVACKVGANGASWGELTEVPLI